MTRYYEWVLERWGRLAPKWRIAALAGFTLALLVASVAGYRQWHYMQHDNRFCTTCHLMADPFRRFSRSVHATLECHNCHEGRLPEQLHQLWLTVVERPTAIGRHARVPNEVCARCHVQGDPTRWKIIAATAGHRIHLESKHPSLSGMRCVECHGVSLHEFEPVDRTCLKAGCHEANTIRLGKMGQMTELHCTTCHNFLASAPGLAVDSLGKPLTPRAVQCLSCHAMQAQIKGLDIARDPHGGVCGYCHNPHTQTKPQDVTCTNAGCHATWRQVSFHVGVPHPERCTTCHEPHSWRVNGKNCVRCHADITRQVPTRGRRAALAPSRPPSRSNVLARDGVGLTPSPSFAPPARHLRSQLITAATAVADFASAGAVASESEVVRAARRMLPSNDFASAGAIAWDDAGQQAQGGRPRAPGGAGRFSHGDHRTESCSSCHSSRVRHGALLVRSSADCARCHHTGPGRDQCATCHRGATAAPPSLQTAQTYRLAVQNRSETRRLPFDHQRHQSVACVRCHTNPVSRAAEGAECAACHASHHRPDANCVACHAGANPIAAHKPADHPNCASTACHGARAANLPATREMCLMCHVTQTRHAPGKVCEQCHQVTARGTR